MTDFIPTIRALEEERAALNAGSKLIQDGADFIPDLTGAPATANAIMSSVQPAKIGKDWQEMSRVEQIVNSLEGGYHNLKKGSVARDALSASIRAEEGLQSVYEVEESLDPEADAVLQALLTKDTQVNRDFKAEAAKDLTEDVQKYQDLRAQDVLYKQPESVMRASKAAEDKGFWTGLGAAAGEFFSGDVVGNAIYLAGTSTGAMLPYLAIGSGAGIATGLAGVGFLANGVRGATLAYGSYQNEAGQFILDEIERRGIKPEDVTPQTFRDIVAGDTFDQFYRDMGARATVVSGFDLVSGVAAGLRLSPILAFRTLRNRTAALVSREARAAEGAARAVEKAADNVATAGVAKTAGKNFGGHMENLLTQATVQGVLGGAGEYLGSKAAGLDPNMADVFFEAVGEFTSAPVEVATSAVSSVTDARQQVLHAQAAKTFQETMQKVTAAAETVGMKFGDKETVAQWASRVGEGKSFSAFAQDLVENKQVDKIRETNPDLADQIEQAAAEGKSVDIPVSTIVSIATNDRKAADDLIMDCRPTVDGLSVRQADDFAKNGRQNAEKQFDRTLKRFRVPKEIEQDSREIGTWIKDRLMEGGFSEDYAVACSSVWQSYLVQRAKLLGTSPKELARMMNWSVDLDGRATTGKTGALMPMAEKKNPSAGRGKKNETVGDGQLPDGALGQELSTAIPSNAAVVKGLFDDPHFVRQWADMSVASQSPVFLKKVVDSFRAIPGLRGAMEGVEDPGEAANVAVNHLADNLVWIYNQIPEQIRARSKLWYDGANKTAKTWARRYGLRTRQTAAIIAIFSPQTDWFLNMSMAERLLDIYFGARRSVPTPEHEAALKARCVTDRINYDSVKGKTLEQLVQEGKLREAGAWVRTYDATHNSGRYNVVTPEGGVGGTAKTSQGKDAAFHYMATTNLGKALSVIVDGSPANIFSNIGKQFKVRDFYNNIYNPHNRKAVTIDTHAVGADTMTVVSADSLIVEENFGKISNSVSGQNGTFPFHFEAYRRAAERVGIDPREMQSITWEGIRALFPEEQKKGLRDKVAAIWDRFDKGEITVDQAREEVVKVAGGFRKTSWEDVPFTDEITETYDRSGVRLYDDITPAEEEPSLSLEAAPDPHDEALVEKWNQLTDEDKLAVTEEIVPWVVERVALATKTYISMPQLQRGGYLGTANYSMSCGIADGGDYVRVARLLASYLRQDSVMALSATPGEGMFSSKVIRIQLPEMFTDEQIDDLYVTRLDKIRDKDGRRLLPGHSAVDGIMTIAVDANDLPVIETSLQDVLGDDISYDVLDANVGFLEPYSEEETSNAQNDTGRIGEVQQGTSSGYDPNLQAETDKRLAEAVDRRLAERAEADGDGQGQPGQVDEVVSPEDAYLQTLDTEYMAAAQSGDLEKCREMVEARAKEAGYGDAIPEQAGGWKVRVRPAPKQTKKAYKVFFVDENGMPTTLFVGDAQPVPRGVWVDAKEAFNIVNPKNGRRYVPTFSNPNRVSADGKKKTQRTGITVPIADEATKAELVRRGYVGEKANSVTAVAYRPGWHAGTLPYFPQGGQKVEGSNYGMVHERKQVVFEIEVAADKDYTDIARAQDKAKTKAGKVDARKADLDYLPANGMYYYTTNPMLDAKEDGWVISDSIKIGRALTQEECDALLAKAGKLPQEWAQGKLVLSDVGVTDPNATDAAKKTLAPITYDEDGNVIPLSKRFDPENDSVLYQEDETETEEDEDIDFDEEDDFDVDDNDENFDVDDDAPQVSLPKVTNKADTRPRVRGAYNPINVSNPTQGVAGVIHLLKTADRSTFMHESAHAWLDADTMLGLKLAQKLRAGEELTDGERAFLRNLGGFFEWGQREKVIDLGVSAGDMESVTYALEQWAHMPVADQRGMHELFARGFEAYLIEGEAPSPEMVTLFQRFRSWLKDIYARARNAIDPISPEVRKLYDLMFVSEQEAADAEARAGLQAMFSEEDQKKLMTDEERAQYEQRSSGANAETQSLISQAASRVMSIFTNKSEKVRKQIMRQYKERVRQKEMELMQLPRYKAWWILRRGWTAADGTVWRFKLSYTSLKRSGFDKETIKLLRKNRFVTHKANGISLGRLAKIVKSPSASILAGELIDLKPAKEMAADIVAAEVKAETGHNIVQYSRLQGDLAAHNATRARLLTAEFNVIARQLGRKQLLVGAAREYAVKRLSSMKMSELKPYSYEQDERRCAKEAEEAWRKGDFPRCLEMKRAQIVNHEMARAALEMQEAQVKAIRGLKRGLKSESVHPANRQILAYVAQLHDLAPLPKQFKVLVKGDKLKNAAFTAAKDLLADGTPVDGLSPDPETGLAQSPILENHLRVSEMTVDMARDLFSMLQQVEKLGRDRLTIERNGVKMDARKEIEAGTKALETAAAKQRRVRQIFDKSPTAKRDIFVDKLKQYFYAHVKISTWCRIFDRNRDGGFFWNHFIRSANERANWEELKRAEVANRLQDILAVVADDKKGIWDRDFVKIGERMMSKGERIAAALNMGNESNLQRLRDGEPTQWTSENIQALKESLTSAEWIMVQNIWDLFESLRPLIAEKQKRVYGVEPIWIDPKPFEVTPKDGETTTVRGGYFPVVYDPRGSNRSEQLSEAAAAEQLMKGAFQSSTTNRSFTKQRSERVLGRPLRLDLSALYSGLGDIIHDLAWHEWLINTQRLLKGVDGDGTGLSKQIKQLYGYHVAKSFNEWVQAIAQGDRSNIESFSRTVTKWLAGNIGLTAMGYSVSSAVSQITGIGYIVPRAGATATLCALRDVMRGRFAIREAINERSDLMRTRYISANRQVSEVRNRIDNGKEGFLKKYAYVMLMGVQHFVDTVCWQAQYRKCMDDGLTEEEAIARADQAVIDTQSSGRIVDESAVERADILGPFTVFYSWANAAFNMEYAVFKGEENRVKRWAALVFFAVLMPQIDDLLRSCLKATGDDGDDDDDDSWIPRMIRDPFANVVELHFGMFVGPRELSSTVKNVITGEKVFDYAGPGGTRGVTVGGKGIQAIAEIGDTLWNDDKELSWKSINALIDVTGFAGAPTAQIKRTIKGARAIETDQAEGFDALKAPIFGFEGPIAK